MLIPLKNTILSPVKQRFVIPVLARSCKKLTEVKFGESPILIGGCGRSGTTLLLSILASHSSVFAVDYETSTFAQWRERNGRPAPNREHWFFSKMLVQRVPKSASRWCEKTPSNVCYIEEILGYFKNRVHFIHLIRDGRDVMTSIHPSDPSKYWVNPDRWVHDVGKGLQYKDHPQVITIRYENLINKFDETISHLCQRLGAMVPADFEDWHLKTSKKTDKAWFGKLEQLKNNMVGRWENEKYKERIEEVMKFPGVADLLQELNYI